MVKKPTRCPGDVHDQIPIWKPAVTPAQADVMVMPDE